MQRLSVKILALGMGGSLQDLGRPGWRRYGVPVGGAMDRLSFLRANQLLGNPQTAACIEFLHFGARLRIEQSGWFALTGAAASELLVAESASWLAAGTELCLQARPGASQALWSYLAAPGGFGGPRWFGSSAVDSRCGLGQQIALGQLLAAGLVAPMCSTERVARRRSAAGLGQTAGDSILKLPVLRGPEWPQFTKEVHQQFAAAIWRVSSCSDRCGYRLEGPVLKGPPAMASEPVLPGSFQIPGNGQPIVTMVDGPTVGGYPKIAVLSEADRSRLAQCAPGTQLRFQWVD